MLEAAACKEGGALLVPLIDNLLGGLHTMVRQINEVIKLAYIVGFDLKFVSMFMIFEISFPFL